MTEFTVQSNELTIEVQNDSLSVYQFGGQIEKHKFCSKCGIYTFHETARKPDHYRINIGCIDGVDSLSLPFGIFDGASL